MGMEQYKKEEPFMTPEEKIFKVKQLAQIEIMSNMIFTTEQEMFDWIQVNGDRTKQEMADWIRANGDRIDKLVRDPNFNFIERFSDPKTHAAALEELKEKLYH